MTGKQPALDAFAKLLDIMDELRQKCPWDQKQTMMSLKDLTIEEVYELSDAVLQEDTESIKKELGDLLLHIVFYSKIASETHAFKIEDVIESICKKLINRHPHIYGSAQVENEQDVRKNWELLKRKEDGNTGVLSGVPVGLPSLIKAHRIQEKVSAVGFDWHSADDVWQKVKEEIQELQKEVISGKTREMEEEFGDVLFSLVNYARFLKINPETALERTNKKFIKRFEYIENHIGKPIHEAKVSEMNVLWDEIKSKR